MQDRFKFRFWHKPTKKMMNVYSYTSDFVFGDTLDGIGTEYNPAKFDDCVLMQCTGLKDKNDKLIFIDDIVTLDNGAVCLVKQVNDKKSIDYGRIVAYSIKTLDKKYKDVYIPTVLSDSEVIGNIYENPELLEGTDENQ